MFLRRGGGNESPGAYLLFAAIFIVAAAAGIGLSLSQADGFIFVTSLIAGAGGVLLALAGLVKLLGR